MGLLALVGAIAVGFALGSSGPEPSPAPPAGSPAGSLPPTAAAIHSASPAPTPVARVVPWLDAPFVPPTPAPTTDPATLPRCDRDSTVLRAVGWGGATGSQGGGVSLVNVSDGPCRLEQPTHVELLDAAGAAIASSNDPIPATADLDLPPAAVAGGILIWDNWCRPTRPTRPLSVLLTLPLAVNGQTRSTTLTAPVDDPGVGSSLPRCDVPDVASSVGLLALKLDAPALSDPPRDPCTPEDLVAMSGPWGGAMGSRYTPVVLMNTGSLDCRLPSPVTVELRDGTGARLLATDGSAAPIAQGSLAPGGTALAILQFADWCAPEPSLPLRLDVVLPGGLVHVVPSRGPDGRVAIPPCVEAVTTAPPAFAFANAFAPPDLPKPPPPDPGDALPVRVDVRLPASISAGTELRYTVTLKNIAADSAPIPLRDACPSFEQRLFLANNREVTTRDLLNCAAAGTIEPGGQRTFEMRIRVPGDTPAGDAVLLWQLGHIGPNSPKLPIRITAP